MKSVIKEAKLTKRYNTGEYEYEEYTLSADVDEKESGAVVLQEMKNQINEAFVGEVKTTAEKPAKKEKKEVKNGTGKTNSASNKNNNDEDSNDEDSGNASESSEDDEATDGEDDNASDDSSDDAEANDESEDGEEASGKGSSKTGKGKSGKDGAKDAAEGKGKKFKTKAQVYNRGIEQHKEIFSGVLRSVSPDWKKSDKTKALAKKASEEMEGENFLDDKGEVLQHFKVLVTRLMKGKGK